MAVGRAEAPRFGASFALALALHGAIVAGAIVVSRRTPPPPLPPVYRVSIVAAPPGERRIGQVRPAPPTPEPEPVAPAPPAAEPPPQAMPAPEPPAPAPRRRQPPATPNPTASRPKPANTPVPRAGGGPTGDRGTDVATVRTEGIDFPYPSYLSNIVRQIALRFKPEAGSARTAEVLFLVHRDGSVTGLRFVRRSGDYAFDLEAQGAVEAAAAANAFGSLPQGFPDDVLPIFFSFDPRVIR